MYRGSCLLLALRRLAQCFLLCLPLSFVTVQLSQAAPPSPRTETTAPKVSNPTTARRIKSTQPAPTSSRRRPDAQVDISKVQVIGPLRIKLLPIPNSEVLEIPYCTPFGFDVETKGGWGEIQATAVQAKRYDGTPVHPSSTTNGTADWVAQANDPTGTALVTSNQTPQYTPTIEANPNSPAPNTKFRIKQFKGMAPRAVEYSFGGANVGLDRHKGHVDFGFADSKHNQVSDRVHIAYVVTPELLRAFVTIGDAGPNDTPQGTYMTVRAAYRSCSNEILDDLWGIRVITDQGQRFDINARHFQLPAKLEKRNYFDVQLTFSGRIASPKVRVNPRKKRIYSSPG